MDGVTKRLDPCVSLETTTETVVGAVLVPEHLAALEAFAIYLMKVHRFQQDWNRRVTRDKVRQLVRVDVVAAQKMPADREYAEIAEI